MADLRELIRRLTEVEKEALASINVISDAVPYFFHQQERYPFWTHRLGSILVDGDGEELDLYRVEIIARLTVAQITDGIVRGDNEARLQDYIPAVLVWVNEHELAQSALYKDVVDGLVRVRVTSCRGYTEFQPGGQIGTEFTFIAEFEEPIEQAYL